jgi:acyl-CoA synthetase (AMP-forming)/AMP-acid ligase II
MRAGWLHAHLLQRIARFKRPSPMCSSTSCRNNNAGKVLKRELRNQLEPLVP